LINCKAYVKHTGRSLPLSFCSWEWDRLILETPWLSRSLCTLVEEPKKKKQPTMCLSFPVCTMGGGNRKNSEARPGRSRGFNALPVTPPAGPHPLLTAHAQKPLATLRQSNLSPPTSCPGSLGARPRLPAYFRFPRRRRRVCRAPSSRWGWRSWLSEGLGGPGPRPRTIAGPRELGWVQRAGAA
jgi:hypothetical protein